MKKEQKDNRPIMVSIRCTVYNHEPYLRKCLDGFVMQQANFRFEVIVHDDASTDGSATVIREYATKYPDIIKPILQTENQYSKHDGSIRRIMESRCMGKYVAICEGDDYWTSPYKLQKQVDFLETNLDYTMCFHKVTVEADEEGLTHMYDKLEGRDYESYEILEEWIVPTCSTMFRKEVILATPQDRRFICGDIVWFLTACRMGKIYCLPEVMGVYRRLSTGMTMSELNKDSNIEKWIEHYKALEYHFPKAGKVARDWASLKMVLMLRINWSNHKMKCICLFFKYCCEGGVHFIYKLLAWFKHLIVVGNK